MANEFNHSDTVQVFESPPELIPAPPLRKLRTPAASYYKPVEAKKSKEKEKDGHETKAEPYLILGFDTEYKTPDYSMTRADVAAGKAKYRVLSYQFHAKTSEGVEWKGICCPDKNDRMSLGDFIIFALGLGIADHGVRDIPTKIYLVGHFTRADIPAFSDFKELTSYLSNVRNTFVSIDSSTTITINHSGRSPATKLRILFRDTLLLTPQASKSLKEIGKLVDCQKLLLDPDPVKHKEMIRNMDRVRRENWDLFKEYAINDATICVRYIERVIAQFEEVTGSKKVPVTLTSIGIELLQHTWKTKKMDPLEILGQEEIEEKYYSKKLQRYVKKSRKVASEEVLWYTDFATECYHGGRNEQFWFGPGFEDTWSDFDLSSAYPTAMSLIGYPDWKGIHEEGDPSKFTATTLGFVRVDFEFPPETRFPTLPVRTEHGLIFPLKGRSYCSSPELVVALQLGAKVQIKKGIIVPTDPKVRVFGEFIKECLEKRKEAGSKTLQGLFWKEISNSTYGKTAQGLRAKRVYDMRTNDTKELPPSQISNPYFAAYITSFTRAILGEIINSLDPSAYVFSCTTDGFLTNATVADMKRIQEQGSLCQIFESARKDLTGVGSVLETKHVISRPLGWRTRGQATLTPGSQGPDDGFNIVLAKGGIYTKPELETVDEQNEEIKRLFFERTGESEIQIEAKTGVRDMVNHDADLVEKVFSKRLNMEFDWKRRPAGVGTASDNGHVLFSTLPWDSKEHFDTTRKAWEKFTSEQSKCMKSMEDYVDFAKFVEVQSFLSGNRAKYLKRSGHPDIVRLRQMLCSAWRESKAGLTRYTDGATASEFAKILCDHDIPCKKQDVENAKTRPFKPMDCPPTDDVRERLKSLKKLFTTLDIEAMLFKPTAEQTIVFALENECPFVKRAMETVESLTLLAA